jgi:hypothetical protein
MRRPYWEASPLAWAWITPGEARRGWKVVVWQQGGRDCGDSSVHLGPPLPSKPYLMPCDRLYPHSQVHRGLFRVKRSGSSPVPRVHTRSLAAFMEARPEWPLGPLFDGWVHAAVEREASGRRPHPSDQSYRIPAGRESVKTFIAEHGAAEKRFAIDAAAGSSNGSRGSGRARQGHGDRVLRRVS